MMWCSSALKPETNTNLKTCLVILHEIGTTHVIYKSVETVAVTCNCVVVIKAIHVDLAQFQFVIGIYSQRITVFWQRLGWQRKINTSKCYTFHVSSQQWICTAVTGNFDLLQLFYVYGQHCAVLGYSTYSAKPAYARTDNCTSYSTINTAVKKVAYTAYTKPLSTTIQLAQANITVLQLRLLPCLLTALQLCSLVQNSDIGLLIICCSCIAVLTLL